jgi:hypothetical protein
MTDDTKQCITEAVRLMETAITGGVRCLYSRCSANNGYNQYTPASLKASGWDDIARSVKWLATGWSARVRFTIPDFYVIGLLGPDGGNVTTLRGRSKGYRERPLQE